MTPRRTTLPLDHDTLARLPLATARQILGTWQLSAIDAQAASARRARLGPGGAGC
jgi:hypothetical protein